MNTQDRQEHYRACKHWLATRPESERAMRELLAGSDQSLDQLTRPVVMTAIGGHYEQPAGWAIALNGSPVQALVVSLRDGGAILWRGVSPRRLRPAQEETVNAYLASLDKPDPLQVTPYPMTMFVDGERLTGPGFHVKPWFWRDPALYEALKAAESRPPDS